MYLNVYFQAIELVNDAQHSTMFVVPGDPFRDQVLYSYLGPVSSLIRTLDSVLRSHGPRESIEPSIVLTRASSPPCSKINGIANHRENEREKIAPGFGSQASRSTSPSPRAQIRRVSEEKVSWWKKYLGGEM